MVFGGNKMKWRKQTERPRKPRLQIGTGKKRNRSRGRKKMIVLEMEDGRVRDSEELTFVTRDQAVSTLTSQALFSARTSSGPYGFARKYLGLPK